MTPDKDYTFLSISFLFYDMKRFIFKRIILTSPGSYFFLKAPRCKTVDGMGGGGAGKGWRRGRFSHVRQRGPRCGHTLKMSSCPPKPPPPPFFWKLQAVLIIDGGNDNKKNWIKRICCQAQGLAKYGPQPNPAHHLFL